MEWSEADLTELRNLMEQSVPLSEIARRLDRPFVEVARCAATLGIVCARRRDPKVPRGKGYDKQAMKRHIVALWRYHGTLPQYTRAHHLRPEPFIAAFRTHYPRAWQDFENAGRAPVPERCPYCENDFYPVNGNQRFCTPKCSQDQAADEQYFGGKRRYTVGLQAGVCQVCGQQRDKGLASHHALGKENDPENEVLIALCAGCHDLVGTIARRLFAADPAAWEALISLALLRRDPEECSRVRVMIDSAVPAV